MSLSDLAALGSLVSSLAVLASLVFLYLQLRQLNAQVLQAETNQRALLNQGVATRNIEGLRWVSEPHISELMSRVFAGETQFSAAEIWQIQSFMRVRLTNIQDSFVQLRSGLIDRITFDSVLQAAKPFLAQRVFRAIWLSARVTHAPELRAYVDGLIAEVPLAQPLDAVAELEAALAAIKK